MSLDIALIIAQLNAPSYSDRIAALRCIKNDVVGHRQRKERWVHRGIIRTLVLIVTSVTDGYTSGKDAQRPATVLKPYTLEETARLHAIQLLTSFANAGPAFLPPIHSAGTIPAILSSACLRSQQPQIILAALRLLQPITVASDPQLQAALSDAVFANDKLELFLEILSQPVPTSESEAQVSLVATLIKNLCREDRHQNAMVNSGILDALATKLASFAVAAGYVLPNAEVLAKSSGLSNYIPQPARSDHGLESVLGAIAAITTDSPFRASKLLFSPSILVVFPNTSYDTNTYSKVPTEIPELPGLRPTRQTDDDPMDLLLPYIPSYTRGVPSVALPPLHASASKDNTLKGRSMSKFNISTSPWSFQGDNTETEAEEAESPLIPWLIHLVRYRSGIDAVRAAAVLTSLFKAGFAYKSREATLGLLVIPVLLSMLSDAESKVKDDDMTALTAGGHERLRLLAEIPSLLARLITDSEPLQKATFECDAAKTLCKLLKNTYDVPLPRAAPQPWSPGGSHQESLEDVPRECRLGDGVGIPGLASRLEIRGSTLLAIGTLATFKEEYRKAILDQDTISYIAESLYPSPSKPKQLKEKKIESLLNEDVNNAPFSEYGNNPPSVIGKACYAVRMLSRSVNILRTALVDNMVAVPVFRLLRHADLEVQTAAAAVTCNLVPNFSPMREPLVEYGVLKVLCEHAHSLDPMLRLNALWALKHLVDSASVELKKKCIEELSSGWLVQLICDDTEDEALFSARIKVDEMDEDADMGVPDYQNRNSPSAPFYRASSAARQHQQPPQQQSQRQPEIPLLRLAEARLAALRDAETNPVRKARHDDLAIQEQGLGFIRNLIGGAYSSSNAAVDPTHDTVEMIDYLFNTLGHDRLFDILAGKLRAKILHPFSRRGTGTGTGAASTGSSGAATATETRVVPPHSKVIEAVIYILVHIAASIPRHRAVVMAQEDLLRQLVKLLDNSTSTSTTTTSTIGSSESTTNLNYHNNIPFVSGSGSGGGSGSDKEIRLALCYLLNNLSWRDDDHDTPACSQRSSELRRLGFVTRLNYIAHADDELDVREHAKTALFQMKQQY